MVRFEPEQARQNSTRPRRITLGIKKKIEMRCKENENLQHRDPIQ